MSGQVHPLLYTWGGKREAGSGTREAGRGKRKQGPRATCVVSRESVWMRSPLPASYSANLHSLSKRRPRIFRRHELLRHVSGESSRRDSKHDRPIIELLRIVDLVTTWHSTRMKV